MAVKGRRLSVDELEHCEYFMLHKFLYENPYYKEKLVNDAKVLFALLFDRYRLSVKNNWVDSEGNVFIIYRREEAMEILRIGNKKIITLFKNLEEVGLLEEERQGHMKPNKIYVLMPKYIEKVSLK